MKISALEQPRFWMAFGLIGALMIAPGLAQDFTPTQKDEIGAIVKAYLIAHPEALREALDALDKQDKSIAANAQKKAVAEAAPILFSSAHQANVGNPKGATSLVEFFDYNCHFCKGALPDMTRLIQEYPNLHVVLKDFPVLGPGSVEAAQVASAVRNQLPGAKFWAFHVKLLSTHGPIGKTEALAVARDMGLDMDKLAKDMESPEIASGIEEVLKVADKLQINGTPTFILGQDIIVGAVGYDQLKPKLDAMRQCGKTVC